MVIKAVINIGSERYFPDGPHRRAEARRSVRLMHVFPGTEGQVPDSAVPDFLVTESMVDRYLEIRPPQFRVETSFDLIISEIERAYVFGQFFAAVAVSVVSIERMLNDARFQLYQYESSKMKKLPNKKGPTNKWEPNINALQKWNYIEDALATELKAVYKIRCRYLHSDIIETPDSDARRCVNAAFRLLTELIGFPERLFRINNSIECLDLSHPLFVVFYKSALQETNSD